MDNKQSQVDLFVNKNLEDIESGSYSEVSEDGKMTISCVSSDEGIKCSTKPIEKWEPKTDIYKDYVVDDKDVDIALKVLRTVRDIHLGPDVFDAGVAVTLSHAHRIIVELMYEVQEMESEVIPDGDCPYCGGRMEVINMYSDHESCDTCEFERNGDGIINSGEGKVKNEECPTCGHWFHADTHGYDSPFALPTQEIQCPKCGQQYIV